MTNLPTFSRLVIQIVGSVFGAALGAWIGRLVGSNECYKPSLWEVWCYVEGGPVWSFYILGLTGGILGAANGASVAGRSLNISGRFNHALFGSLLVFVIAWFITSDLGQLAQLTVLPVLNSLGAVVSYNLPNWFASRRGK